MPQIFGGGAPDPPAYRPPSVYVPDWTGALNQAISQQAPDYYSRTSGGGSPEGLAQLALGQLGPHAPASLDAMGLVQQYLAHGANQSLPSVAPLPGTTPAKTKVLGTGDDTEETLAKAQGAAPQFLAGLGG